MISLGGVMTDDELRDLKLAHELEVASLKASIQRIVADNRKVIASMQAELRMAAQANQEILCSKAALQHQLNALEARILAFEHHFAQDMHVVPSQGVST